MNIDNKTITGQELTTSTTSPYAALADFYRAFNKQNFTLMADNWAKTTDASMSNPLGGIKRGWDDIKEVYQKIFNGPATVYVEFYDYSVCETDEMFVAVGRERGTLELNQQTIELSIRTSRTYLRINKHWKQIHHHGSMDNPELLGLYQNILTNTVLPTDSEDAL
ncbi:MAG: nuclear transport factor 2 family protein [Ectothiorhodospiraceae bacterium]|nr:nuclear transport factor 2 family protein [Ectothiorhodospiraceae bacterium]